MELSFHLMTHGFSWILLLARFCTAALKLCPDFEKCITLSTASAAESSSSTTAAKRSMSRSISRSQAVDPLWQQTEERLEEVNKMCLRWDNLSPLSNAYSLAKMRKECQHRYNYDISNTANIATSKEVVTVEITALLHHTCLAFLRYSFRR